MGEEGEERAAKQREQQEKTRSLTQAPRTHRHAIDAVAASRAHLRPSAQMGRVGCAASGVPALRHTHRPPHALRAVVGGGSRGRGVSPTRHPAHHTPHHPHQEHRAHHTPHHPHKAPCTSHTTPSPQGTLHITHHTIPTRHPAHHTPHHPHKAPCTSHHTIPTRHPAHHTHTVAALISTGGQRREQAPRTPGCCLSPLRSKILQYMAHYSSVHSVCLRSRSGPQGKAGQCHSGRRARWCKG